MVLKIFKAVWFLSLAIWLAFFLFVYASLPEQVMVRQADTALVISREVLFYSFLIFVVLINAMVFAIARLYRAREPFLSWFFGLMTCLNVFFVIVINFLNLVNSGEKYRYAEVGFIIYGSLFLFIAWAASWPVYSIFRKISSKQAV